LFLTDDQPLGYEAALPFTQRYIFERGVSFDESFVSTSLCCPSRSSLLTGQYTHNHGVLSNAGRGGADDFHRLGGEARTLGTLLQSAGYRTGFIGKYLNQYPGESELAAVYVPVGWDEWVAAVDIYPTILPYGQFDYTLIENGQAVRYGNADRDYFSDVVTSKAADFVSNALSSGQPFFVIVAYISPHAPAEAPLRHRGYFRSTAAPRGASFNEADVSDKPAWLSSKPLLDTHTTEQLAETHRRMLRSLISVDEGVRRIVELVADRNQLDRTFFVFTSDNGLHLGEHRIANDKNTPYEEAIRVPLGIIGPGTGRGVKRTEMVVNIDLAPTILELANIPIPAYMDGRSLVPLLEADSPTPSTWRQRFLLEHYAPYAGEGLNIDPRPNRLEYVGVRTRDHVYVEYAYGDFELYDLLVDPNQLENIYYRADPSLLSALRQHLEELRLCAGSECVEAEDR